jgi:LAO/AO transport system kinase
MEKNNKSALKVNKGIEQPKAVNEKFVNKVQKFKAKSYGLDYYVNGIIKGERRILAQAITLVESTKKEHRKLAENILEECLPKAKESIRIGITGVPGVGKSTFIEAFGKFLTSQGHKVAVLAIDPSSNKNKGSILGDKTRMEELSSDKNAFIRPSPSSGSLGGVAQKTRESISLCEAAGFDIILVETVGVGQSEIAVHSMVDFFLLLMLSGAGDELQGIKRGIIEMSDAILINKADGDNLQKAEMSKVQYANALHLFPATESSWTPVADICSAVTGMGIDRLWSYIKDYEKLTKDNGYFFTNRKQQELFRFHEQIERKLKQYFYENNDVKKLLNIAEEKILNNKKSAYQLAEELILKWKKCN